MAVPSTRPSRSTAWTSSWVPSSRACRALQSLDDIASATPPASTRPIRQPAPSAVPSRARPGRLLSCSARTWPATGPIPITTTVTAAAGRSSSWIRPARWSPPSRRPTVIIYSGLAYLNGDAVCRPTSIGNSIDVFNAITFAFVTTLQTGITDSDLVGLAGDPDLGVLFAVGQTGGDAGAALRDRSRDGRACSAKRRTTTRACTSRTWPMPTAC